MRNKVKQAVQGVIGLVIGVLILWWMFQGTSWSGLKASFEEIRWGWVALAIGLVTLSFFGRVKRWTYVVRAVEPGASFRSMFSATQIGFLANFTLPARIGELVRAIVLARLTALSVTRSFALVALDRVNDLIGLIAVMAFALLAYKPDKNIEIPGELFRSDHPILVPAKAYQTGALGAAVFLIGVITVFVLLYINKNLVLRLSDSTFSFLGRRLSFWKPLDKLCGKLGGWAHHMLEQFAEGFRVFRSISDMAKSIAYNLATWTCFVVTLQCMLFAFGIDAPWYTVFVMQAALAIAISVPGTPGFVGQFQVPLVAGLKLVAPEVSYDAALALAILTHAINAGMVIIVGIVCLQLEGLHLFQLSEEGAKKKETLASSEASGKDSVLQSNTSPRETP
ncbi:MAG: lysylphosphatidylglycerol synthase transmembrane domain-containing protein [Candidatus Hydrogenedentota bacterium]